MNTTGELTFEDILRRKLNYWSNNRDPVFAEMRNGILRGLTQMLADLQLTEAVFERKYAGILSDLNAVFDAYEANPDPAVDIDELSGYNNAIADMLSLLNLSHFYHE